MITNVYHADIDLRAIMDAADTRIGSSTQIRWFLRDQFILALKFKRQTSGVWAAFDLSGIVSFRAMLKPSYDRDGDALALIENADFNKAVDWSEISTVGGCICMRVDLNTAALIAKFATSMVSAEYVFEIEGTDAEGKISTLLQFELTVIHDIVTGSEGASASTASQYVTIEQMLAVCCPRNLSGGDYRVKDSKLQKYNRTSGLWHDWGFEVKDGANALWIGAGEA